MKGFNMTMDYVLNNISYTNLILICATLPSYDSNNSNRHETIDADNPNNKNEVEQFFKSIQ